LSIRFVIFGYTQLLSLFPVAFAAIAINREVQSICLETKLRNAGCLIILCLFSGVLSFTHIFIDWASSEPGLCGSKSSPCRDLCQASQTGTPLVDPSFIFVRPGVYQHNCTFPLDSYSGQVVFAAATRDITPELSITTPAAAFSLSRNTSPSGPALISFLGLAFSGGSVIASNPALDIEASSSVHVIIERCAFDRFSTTVCLAVITVCAVCLLQGWKMDHERKHRCTILSCYCSARLRW